MAINKEFKKIPRYGDINNKQKEIKKAITNDSNGMDSIEKLIAHGAKRNLS